MVATGREDVYSPSRDVCDALRHHPTRGAGVAEQAVCRYTVHRLSCKTPVSPRQTVRNGERTGCRSVGKDGGTGLQIKGGDKTEDWGGQEDTPEQSGIPSLRTVRELLLSP